MLLWIPQTWTLNTYTEMVSSSVISSESYIQIMMWKTFHCVVWNMTSQTWLPEDWPLCDPSRLQTCNWHSTYGNSMTPAITPEKREHETCMRQATKYKRCLHNYRGIWTECKIEIFAVNWYILVQKDLLVLESDCRTIVEFHIMPIAGLWQIYFWYH